MEIQAQVIRTGIERIKDIFDVAFHRRALLEDLLNSGDCFLHIETNTILPAQTIFIIQNFKGEILSYEQREGGVVAAFKPEEILHLKKV